ncbi:MAG: hypothetical protein K2W96_28515 [Gemmataceae bacterium]|nr:hypothetical protein [Gemmataceae bacterium]
MRTMLAVLALASMARAEALKPTMKWSGRVSNEAAAAKPATGYVSGPKELAKLWKAWKIGDKPPAIDFKKEIVLVVTSQGSGIGVDLHLDKGDLTNMGAFTDDLGTDTGYVIVAVPSKGVKTVYGKPLKLELKPEEP